MKTLSSRDRSIPVWAIHGSMLLSATLVSTSFIVGKIVTPHLDPVVLTLIRFALASVLFAPFVKRRHALALPSFPALVRYSLISGSLAGFFWLMFLSLRITTPLHTAAIFTTVPGLSGVYGWFILRERLGPNRALALFLAMTGALWVIFEGNLQQLLSFDLNRGDLLFFGGCLLMALYTPLVKLLHRGEPMAVMTLWVLITGCGWLLLFAALELPAIQWASVPIAAWIGIAYLALFTTIITFFITQWATLHLGPTQVMAYSYLYPPLIVFLEWFFYQTVPAAKTMLGILIILPAMIIVQKGGDHPLAERKNMPFK